MGDRTKVGLKHTGSVLNECIPEILRYIWLKRLSLTKRLEKIQQLRK